jgi:bifunctional DNA-binding transcriptional regulator/antitoxin component of YhaV-PrlF toxin-antitoxin module
MSHVIEITVDDEGRIRLSSETLRALGLKPGMTLIIEEAQEGAARLSVQAEEPSLVNKGGVLVVQGVLTEDAADIVRRERDRHIDELIERTGL